MSTENLELFYAIKDRAEYGKRLTETAGKAMLQLRKRLEEGETTGDNMRDLLIIRYGENFQREEERYRSLDEQVRSHEGELVLKVDRVERSNEDEEDYDEENPKYSVQEYFKLGIINAPGLVIGPHTDFNPKHYSYGDSSMAGTCDIPTEKHVFKSIYRDFPSEEDIRIKEGNMCGFPGHEYTTKVHHPYLRDQSLDGSGEIVMDEIICGNEAVKIWFKDRKKEDVFDQMYGMLTSGDR